MAWLQGHMRVLHVIPGLANSSGPTHVVINLTEHLAKLGCVVTVYHVQYDDIEALRPDPDLVATKGFPLTFSRRWGYSRGLGRALRETVRNFDIVHIHSVWMYPTLAAARACRDAGVPYVLRPAGSFEPWCLRQNRAVKRIYYMLVERRNVAVAAAIQAMSQQEREHFRDLGIREKVVVIPNGVSEEALAEGGIGSECREHWGIGKTTPVVLFLSRLHPKKGLDILIEAFSCVLRVLADARLVIVGPPAPGYGKRIDQMLREYGIEESTVVAGELRGQDKWAAYQAADVFVLPSRSENFGIVVAEAMACGVPVVVSRETPWEEVETRKAGFWVNLDVDEIAQAILIVLENRRLAAEMGRNGQALVRERYTWDRIAERMLKVYENILAGREPDAGLGDPGGGYGD